MKRPHEMEALSENPIIAVEEEDVICPSCLNFTITQYCYPVGDLYTGIVFGYFLYCPNCKERIYINQLGRPPWFDLSRQQLNPSIEEKNNA